MAKAGGKIGQVAIWILLVALIIGLAGFGITGFGTSVRALGSVGDAEISADDYARALQQEMNALSGQFGRPIGFAEAQGFGLDRTVLQRLVATAALDNEAQKIGLSVGDAELARAIREMPSFASLTGEFDRDTYRFALERNNLSEADFETSLRADIARGLLQSAVAGGVTAPPALIDTFTDFLSQERSFRLLQLTADDLDAPIAARSDDALRAFHTENPALFTRPQIRRLRHAVLRPEDLLDQVTLDETILRAAYADRADEYIQPERRLIERLVFADFDAANTARAQLDAGSVTFDDLVARRGLALADVDLGDLARDEMAKDDGEAVFAADVPGIAGPVSTLLGPAIFRVNAVFARQETTFEEARADLFAELALDGARRLIADRLEGIEDDLAGGATLDDLAAAEGMEIGETDLTATLNEGLAAYPAFRDRAQAMQEGDFAEIVQLEDGAIAVVELITILPPEVRPYEDVADAVAEAARAADATTALMARRDAIGQEVRDGAALGQFGIVTVLSQLARSGFIDGAPASVLPRVFALAPGDVGAVDGPDFVGLVVLDTVHSADRDDPARMALYQALSQRLGQDMAQDIFGLYAARVQAQAEIQLNTAAVDAVNAQMR